MHFYTLKDLKKKTVELSTETTVYIGLDLKGEKGKEFVANYKNSIINFTVPAEIICVLGRLYQNNNHLELGYFLDEDIWYILKRNNLLWSSKVINLKKKEKPKFNRFTALTKNNLDSNKK